MYALQTYLCLQSEAHHIEYMYVIVFCGSIFTHLRIYLVGFLSVGVQPTVYMYHIHTCTHCRPIVICLAFDNWQYICKCTHCRPICIYLAGLVSVGVQLAVYSLPSFVVPCCEWGEEQWSPWSSHLPLSTDYHWCNQVSNSHHKDGGLRAVKADLPGTTFWHVICLWQVYDTIYSFM